MSISKLTNCSESTNIIFLLSKIDCKLAELGNTKYNNISFMLNEKDNICSISKLLIYKRILLYKYKNIEYLKNWCLADIMSVIKKLTSNCVSKCFKPEDCYSQNYEFQINPK